MKKKIKKKPSRGQLELLSTLLRAIAQNDPKIPDWFIKAVLNKIGITYEKRLGNLFR